jgi:hypothetical protein
MASFTELSRGLVRQLNLLLGASADPQISDVLLSHHFATRSIPDGRASSSYSHNTSFADFGGWLMRIPDAEQGLGDSLFFVTGPYKYVDDKTGIPPNGTVLWQSRFFPRPESDGLLPENKDIFHFGSQPSNI